GLQDVKHRPEERNMRPPLGFERPDRPSVSCASIIHAAIYPREALPEHGLEHEIHENQGQDKMHLAPKFTHEPPGYLWIPMVHARKQREDRPGRDNVMEVRDH